MLFQLLTPHWWLGLIQDWFLWYAATVLLGWLVFPLLFSWLPSLPDRGFAVARIAGAFLFSYLNWLLCHRFLAFSAASMACALGILALLSALHVWRHWGALGQFIARRWRWMLAAEALSLVLFMALVNIRSYCADIQPNPAYHGAEKLANSMLFNSLYRTDHFPAEDAWFCQIAADDTHPAPPVFINYYYGGHLQWATLARLTGTPTAIAFNLALASLFSFIGMGAFGVMLNLTQRIAPAVICALVVVFAGNLQPFEQLLQSGKESDQSGTAQTETMGDRYEQWHSANAPNRPFSFNDFMLAGHFNLWQPSRVILSRAVLDQPADDYTVNEFPYFSFILGDLHAHSSALMLTLLLLNVLLGIYYLKQEIGSRWLAAFVLSPGASLLLAALVGGLYFYNAWDIVPLFLLLAVMFLWDRDDWRSSRWLHISEAALIGVVLFGVGLFGLFGLFTFQLQTPFAQTAAVSSPASLPANALLAAAEHAGHFFSGKIILRPHYLGSSAKELTIFWGLFALPLMLLLIGDIGYRLRNHWNQKMGLIVALVVFLLALLGFLYDLPGAQICFLFLLASAMFAWRREATDAQLFASRLMLAGFFIVFFAETLVINDSMTGAFKRYNTVFKLYYPAWTFLALCTVYFIDLQDRHLKKLRRFSQLYSLRFGALVLLLLGFTYPFLATWARTDGFETAKGDRALNLLPARPFPAYCRRTLDGLAFLGDPAESPDDLAAIEWLNQHVSDRPHILEAANHAYSYYGRVAGYTGLPTIIGWDNHELQWRGWNLSAEVSKRQAEVRRAYETTDIAEALPVLAGYNIHYVFIGSLEHAAYPAAGLNKFATMGREVFRRGNTVIYDVSNLVRSAAQLPMLLNSPVGEAASEPASSESTSLPAFSEPASSESASMPASASQPTLIPESATMPASEPFSLPTSLPTLSYMLQNKMTPTGSNNKAQGKALANRGLAPFRPFEKAACPRFATRRNPGTPQ